VAVWLVLEIWLLILIAGAAGGWVVLLMLLAGVVCGGAVIRRAGRRAVRTLRQTLRAQQAGEPVEGDQRGGGGLLIAAGMLLIIPGPVSDALGLLLLLPPLRGAISRAMERALQRRMGASVPGTWSDAFQQARMRRGGGHVVQGEVVRDDDWAEPDRQRGPRPPLAP
jgi:UPF0716 protein FxsA